MEINYTFAEPNHISYEKGGGRRDNNLAPQQQPRFKKTVTISHALNPNWGAEMKSESETPTRVGSLRRNQVEPLCRGQFAGSVDFP